MKKSILVAGLAVGACGGVLALNSTLTIRCGTTRVEAETVAISAAMESYKMDHGEYPSDLVSEKLSPEQNSDPATYIAASQFLYRVLSGDSDGNPDTSSPADTKLYFPFDTRPQMLRQAPQGGYYVIDPWGNAYGYSTMKAKHPKTKAGHNATFDLWSTSGGKRPKDRGRWVKNW